MKVVAWKVERIVRKEGFGNSYLFPYLMMKLKERIVYCEFVTLEPF